MSSTASAQAKCGWTQEKLVELMEKSNYGENKAAYSRYFFKATFTSEGINAGQLPMHIQHMLTARTLVIFDDDLDRCKECGQTIGKHANSAQKDHRDRDGDGTAHEDQGCPTFLLSIFLLAGCDAKNPHGRRLWFPIALFAVVCCCAATCWRVQSGTWNDNFLWDGVKLVAAVATQLLVASPRLFRCCVQRSTPKRWVYALALARMLTLACAWLAHHFLSVV